MRFTSPFSPVQIAERLRDQLDELHSGIRSLVPRRPMSPVCGRVSERELELRSTWGGGALCSLRAKGILTESQRGAEIELWFEDPILFDPFASALNRSKYDKERILRFLRTWIEIEPAPSEETAQPSPPSTHSSKPPT